MIDRSVQYPNRFQMVQVEAGVYDLTPSPGEVTQEGTPISKATLFDDNNATRYNVDDPDAAFEVLVNEWQVNVLATNWSTKTNADGYYTNIVDVAGMRSVFTPLYALNETDATLIDDAISAFAEIKRMTTSDDSVTFLALDRIDTDIPIRIKGV